MTTDLIPSTTHLVLIPSYNTGPILRETVASALAAWAPVWVVIDGSTDGSPDLLADLQKSHQHLRIIVLPKNQGKGAALYHGMQMARQAGFSHVLTMDSDGQHPAEKIPRMMDLSRAEPDRMILGRPIFAADAPALRVKGREISNWWVKLETLWGGIGDSLFGFRVYPLEPSLEVLRRTRFARRFDFEPEMAVRLFWAGVEARNVAVPVRYLSADQGGVSHFHYYRDNAWLTWMHLRLMLQFLPRIPALWVRRLQARGRRRDKLAMDLDSHVDSQPKTF